MAHDGLSGPDPAAVAGLLAALASDDRLRARFEADPRETLAELGIEPPDALPARVTLPSKTALKRALLVATVAGLPLVAGNGGGTFWTFS